MSEQAFGEFLERMKSASKRLDGLLDDHQEGFTTWWILLDNVMKELNEVWSPSKK